ncbi:MAG: 1-(5-phosphoribosyl)-5-[(5-phosphoribosylamino)methylideneamino]imidazole-4-carboxamide isomerase [Planctomycetales bacterium]|nr:1-(5-phosphoribosyl)-5-[(5-phosphoribosylamino)methylideneamino]imidazole-4-carboxamide isomerase [Planctomycetales bacterium]
MQIWPAIDLRGGQCVRLQQGDYARETIFESDPAQVARRWRNAGAEFIHLVDLDGARDGQLVNRDSIAAIVHAVDIPCELGGGIRDEAAIEELLALGLHRLVIGTLALKEPEWFRAMCHKYPHKLVLGVDARDGFVATDGWLETSQVSAIELASQFASDPLAAVVYTDIARDGMMQGPNLQAMAQMQQALTLPVIASGGVSCVDDVRQLAKIPMAGVIIGRALYDGTVTIEAALEAAGTREATTDDH